MPQEENLPTQVNQQEVVDESQLNPSQPESPQLTDTPPATSEEVSKPEDESPTPEADSEDSAVEDEEAPDYVTHFQELRDKMVAEGVDFTEMDAKLNSGTPLTEEEVLLCAKHSGYEPSAVKAYTSLLAANVSLLSQKQAEEAATEYATKKAAVDEAAGGSYQELAEAVATLAPPATVAVWKAAIEGSDDIEVHKAVAAQMKQYRDANSAAAPAPDKKSNLGILTQSSAQVNPATQQSTEATADKQSQETEDATQAKNQLAAQEAIVESLTTAQLSSIRQAGPSHPLFSLVDARLNKMLGI